jgi:hypothetical protein
MGGWVGLRAVLDTVGKRKIPSLRREAKPRTPKDSDNRMILKQIFRQQFFIMQIWFNCLRMEFSTRFNLF